jgi:hypothetical protein
MTEPLTDSGIERTGYFRPRTFFAAFLAGLVLCSFLARRVSRTGYHEDFTRFHQVISPEAQYYPTLEEMCGIVRTSCRPDQILVIVGGNSIFNGVGQPADKMWTVELQRQLGDRFAVVNLAFRGALCTDGGAVVAEVLRKEFPRQVYVANTAPFSEPAPYGVEPYRYLFWEARSRGLAESFAPREELVSDYVGSTYHWGERFNLRALGWLDRALRFRDLWNWVGYEYIFTIQNPIVPHMPGAILPRKDFPDSETDFESQPFENRFRPEYMDAEMRIVRAFSGNFYFRDFQGHWRLKPFARMEFDRVAGGAFPDDLKARTLIMLSGNSPHYLKELSADEKLRDDLAYREGVAEWKKMGYASDDYGRDYDETDFGDRTHLTSTGGAKLAVQVGDDVREIARKLGFLHQEYSKP